MKYESNKVQAITRILKRSMEISSGLFACRDDAAIERRIRAFPEPVHLDIEQQVKQAIANKTDYVFASPDGSEVIQHCAGDPNDSGYIYWYTKNPLQMAPVLAAIVDAMGNVTVIPGK